MDLGFDVDISFDCDLGPPREHIDALIEEHLQVVSVTEMHHLLVEHCI